MPDGGASEGTAATGAVAETGTGTGTCHSTDADGNADADADSDAGGDASGGATEAMAVQPGSSTGGARGDAVGDAVGGVPRVGSGGDGTIGSSVFTSDLMFWAAAIAAAAVVTLVVIDRREPARRRPVVPRGPAGPGGVVDEATARDVALPRRSVAIHELATRPYRRTPLWRRLFAIVGLGAIGTVLGTILAIVVTAAIVGFMLFVAAASR